MILQYLFPFSPRPGYFFSSVASPTIPLRIRAFSSSTLHHGSPGKGDCCIWEYWLVLQTMIVYCIARLTIQFLGTQGYAVASSLLKSQHNFIVRALTRNPNSEKAQNLAKMGAQVVKADGFSDEEMNAALAGSWGFWLNTHHHDQV